MKKKKKRLFVIKRLKKYVDVLVIVVV